MSNNPDANTLGSVLEKAGPSSMADKTHKAAALSPGRTCPLCRKGELRRSRREVWMTWVPASKYYGCSKCKTGFLRLFDAFELRMADGKRDPIGSISARNRKKRIVLVSSAIMVLVYACYRIVISLYEGVLQ
jgi:hypothetical protein